MRADRQDGQRSLNRISLVPRGQRYRSPVTAPISTPADGWIPTFFPGRIQCIAARSFLWEQRWHTRTHSDFPHKNSCAPRFRNASRAGVFELLGPTQIHEVARYRRSGHGPESIATSTYHSKPDAPSLRPAKGSRVSGFQFSLTWHPNPVSRPPPAESASCHGPEWPSGDSS